MQYLILLLILIFRPKDLWFKEECNLTKTKWPILFLLCNLKNLKTLGGIIVVIFKARESL